MCEKIYLYFLILCGILFSGIIASLADNDTRKSSDFLVRKRRVISHIPGGSTPTRIEDANYMANIQADKRAKCAGAILSHYTVITAASCVILHISHYRVLSGATYEHYHMFHNVTSKDVHNGYPPDQQYDGIALITVDPPFQFNFRTGYIQLYVGPLPAGTLVTVSGWGISYPPEPGPTGLRRTLRTITLPIMNHEECKNDYRGYFTIKEKHICTYDERQYCARTDEGAPLVVNNRLAGIHVWKGFHCLRNPDVFIDLQRPDYSAWIHRNTLLM